MRPSHVATALAAFTAGLTASAALRRRADLRAPETAAATAAALPSVVSLPDRAVVLPFVRPVMAGPVRERPAAPANCGDSGGRTKAGTPCAAWATAGGRCHHHRLAA